MLKKWPSLWSIWLNLRQIWLTLSLNDTVNITHEKTIVWFWRFCKALLFYWDFQVLMHLPWHHHSSSPPINGLLFPFSAIWFGALHGSLSNQTWRLFGTKVDTTTNFLGSFSTRPSSINALLTRRLTSYLPAFTSCKGGRLLPINAEITFILYSFSHIWSLHQAQITRVEYLW